MLSKPRLLDSEKQDKSHTLSMSAPSASTRKDAASSERAWFGPLLLSVLAAQNVGIYWNHYFGNTAFPWDFTLTYHAVPYFWTTLMKQGVFPEWVPFQGMGYPLVLNIQSNLFYFPFYFFVVSPLSFTFKAAVVVQGLHVLLGAVGFYVLLKRSGLSRAYALLGAFTFQLFGGFFSNAQHSDIIRAYALTPWLFAALGSMRSGARVTDLFTYLVLPPGIYLMLTGGYPGTSMATLFMLGVFVMSELAFQRASWSVALALAGLMMLGVLMASVAVVPPFVMQEEIARAHNAAAQVREFITLKHLFTLFQPAYFDTLVNDLSMRSLRIGLPIVVCLFFVSWSAVKEQRSWITIAVTAYLLGSGGVLYQLVTGILPPLGLSRFPIADYRHLIALGLIVIVVAGLERGLVNWRDGWANLRVTSFWTAFVLSVWVLGFKATDGLRFWLGLAIALTSLVLVMVWSQFDRARPLLIPCLMALLVLDSVRAELQVTPSPWVDWNGLTKHRVLHGDLNQVAPSLLERIHGVRCRPARNTEPHDLRQMGFTGYFTGDYMVEDYSGPMQFVRQKRILADPVLKRFAVQAWRAVEVEDELNTSLRHRLVQASDAPGVSCLQYRINDLTLSVNLNTPRTIVENEIYHAGWHGRLVDEAGDQIAKLDPIDVQGFRAWRLPAGRYRLIEEFHTPFLSHALAASLVGASLWLAWTSHRFAIRSRSRRVSP